jgi:hypothetical protein
MKADARREFQCSTTRPGELKAIGRRATRVSGDAIDRDQPRQCDADAHHGATLSLQLTEVQLQKPHE